MAGRTPKSRQSEGGCEGPGEAPIQPSCPGEGGSLSWRLQGSRGQEQQRECVIGRGEGRHPETGRPQSLVAPEMSLSKGGCNAVESFFNGFIEI